MIVNVTVEGDQALIARFEQMPSAVNEALFRKVTILSLKLENLVKTGKLNGQVLNRVTGALARSIHSKVDRNTASVIGRVFSSGDVKYARIHEYGGKTAPHIIEPKNAKALAFGGGVYARVNHPGSVMPERSFLRSALHDMSTEISIGLKQAVVQALVKQVKG